MPKNLYQITPTTPENIRIAGVRVALQGLLYLQGKAIHPATHIGPACGQPDAHTRGWHHHPRNTDSTRRSAATLTPSSILTRTLPFSSISINPVRRGVITRDGNGSDAAGVSLGTGAIRAGKRCSSEPQAVSAAARRRQR